MKNRNRQPLFCVRNAHDGNPELLLYDDIGPSWLGMIGADLVKQQLKAIGNVPEIDVHINSAGGDVFEGFTIYQMLSDHPAKVNVFVDGMAASIASVIAMSGDHIAIAQQAMFMIHNARGGVWGIAEDMRKMADLLETINGKIVGIYHARSQAPQDKLQEQMNEETWIDAEQALVFGFADEVMPNKQAVSAHFDPQFHNFKHFPQNWQPDQLDWERVAQGGEQPRLAAARERLATFGQ